MKPNIVAKNVENNLSPTSEYSSYETVDNCLSAYSDISPVPMIIKAIDTYKTVDRDKKSALVFNNNRPTNV